jgi:SOS-response transcriptional repressor LexA
MTTATDHHPPTDRQIAVLRWASKFISDNGFSPTVREVSKAFQFASPNGAMAHLRPLRRKGLVTWNAKQPRTLRVLKEV